MTHCKHTRDPAQEHEHVEKLKPAQTAKNRSEQTHPGAVDPFPKGGRADHRIQISPMSLDLVDPGVDLYITQLVGEGTVGTTCPCIHPHGSHPLTVRENL
jgi:hypothetical protein